MTCVDVNDLFDTAHGSFKKPRRHDIWRQYSHFSDHFRTTHCLTSTLRLHIDDMAVNNSEPVSSELAELIVADAGTTVDTATQSLAQQPNNAADSGSGFKIAFQGAKPREVTLIMPSSHSDDQSSYRSSESAGSRRRRLQHERAEEIRTEIASRRPMSQQYLPAEGRFGEYRLSNTFDLHSLRAGLPIKDYALSEQLATAKKLLESGQLSTVLTEDSKYAAKNEPWSSDRQEPVKLETFVSVMGKTASEVQAYNEAYPTIMDTFWKDRTIPLAFMECDDRSKLKMREEYLAALSNTSYHLIRSKVADKSLNEMTEPQQSAFTSIREGVKSKLSYFTDYDSEVPVPSAKDEYDLFMTHKELGEAHAEASRQLQTAYQTALGQKTDVASTTTSSFVATAKTAADSSLQGH